MGPLTVAWCAVNRITPKGRVLGEAQRITVAEALHAITLGPAKTLKMDDEIGSIETGKKADFAVLADDPLSVRALRAAQHRGAGHRLRRPGVHGMSGDAANQGGGLAPLPVPPLPVTVISGYLGAGKTTLVNRLLTEAHGRRITVLVNDFGEIPLDESLILNRDGDTLSLANGCMCCSIGGDLFDAIDRILEARPRAEHLVIETSGVADPAKVAQIALAEPDMALALTATLVNAANFEAGLADPLLADTLVRQVRAAGLVVISKADHAGAEATAALAAKLSEMGPRNAPRRGRVRGAPHRDAAGPGRGPRARRSRLRPRLRPRSRPRA